ncbi:MAG: hypothetical protein KAJ19_03735 [Gammaproteobacteria bacterium]|nr:hypothetical protein [Gammaproteobacteria bacterium]
MTWKIYKKECHLCKEIEEVTGGAHIKDIKRWTCDKCRNTILSETIETEEQSQYGLCGKVLMCSGKRVACDGPGCQLWIIGSYISKDFSVKLRSTGACSEKVGALATVRISMQSNISELTKA